jgi:hypothetical protein
MVTNGLYIPSYLLLIINDDKQLKKQLSGTMT